MYNSKEKKPSLITVKSTICILHPPLPKKIDAFPMRNLKRIKSYNQGACSAHELRHCSEELAVGKSVYQFV